jgi:integrase
MICGTRALRCYSVRACTRKIVPELLGHATIAITLDTYSHVLPDMQGEAVSAMEATLSH